MLSAVLQPEIDTLQSQIAQLQAQIAAAQERVKELGEAESIADGAIASLQTALLYVSALAPSAIATLRQTVLNLFNGDGDASDDGNQPVAPAPQPTPGGESVDVPLEPEPETEPVESPSPAWELVPISDTVAYFKSPEGEIGCTYAGFNNKGTAKRWGEWLALNHSVANGFEVREAKRLTNFKHELKLWGMSPKQIQRLSECDLRKSPPDNYGDAPKRPAQPAPPARPSIEVGDIVSSTVVPHWQYEVVEVEEGGKLQCRRLDNPTVVVAQSEWSVTLVSKAPKEVAHLTIDVTNVPQGIVLRSTDDTLIAEYTVFALVIIRHQGVPKAQQKMIGRLIEGSAGVEAYKPLSGLCQTFERTLDAVNYLLNSSDYRMSDVIAAVELCQKHSESQPEATTVDDADCEIEECLVTERDLAVTARSEPPSFQVGDRVEVFSNRHGDDLVGQIGQVTIANPVGCVVVVAGQSRWFCVDEIVALVEATPARQAKSDLFPAPSWGVVHVATCKQKHSKLQTRHF